MATVDTNAPGVEPDARALCLTPMSDVRKAPTFIRQSPEPMEADLMRRVASGDRDAVGAVYDAYASVLLPVAFRIVGNVAEAEDVLHDAFVTLPGRAQHYAPERGSVVAWLIILVRNLSLDRTRRRAVRQSFAREPTSPDVAAAGGARETDNPETNVAMAGQRDRLRRAFTQLPQAQQATLQTAFFEGLSYPEIAARDGVSLGTVKSRAARALAALREALGDEDLDLA